ncbi:hypothetical protein C0993_006493 [Termitomyces sp. T159_Od127]|nr:hypothetical protein C0993_006493 [Termitomyces sp. T159_Od127]
MYTNADRGVMHAPIDELTADGYDLQFGTNVLGHYYLTKLLLPTLLATARSSPDKHVRVLTTSSIMHYIGSLDFNTFKDGPARRRRGTELLYAQSKYVSRGAVRACVWATLRAYCFVRQGDLVMAMELARRYGAQGVVSTAINPGNLDTDLMRHMGPVALRLLKLILHPMPQGALTQLWGATAAEGAQLNGKYLAPWARVRVPRSDALEPRIGKELWEWLDAQVKAFDAPA